MEVLSRQACMDRYTSVSHPLMQRFASRFPPKKGSFYRNIQAIWFFFEKHDADSLFFTTFAR